MKLPTKEELKQDFLASSETLHEWALRRIQEAVRLAEEEARREALDKAMSILHARSMLSSMHKTDCDAIRYSLQEIEALKAAPATAEAGKEQRIRDASKESHTTTFAQVHADAAPPAPPPSRALTEERVNFLIDAKLCAIYDHLKRTWERHDELAAKVERLDTDYALAVGGIRKELARLDKLASARSAAGGKTGEASYEQERVADALRNLVARCERAGWMRETCHELELAQRAINALPAAREGSGA